MRCETRKAASIFAVTTLLAVTVFCPLLICAEPSAANAGRDCCSHSRCHSQPCDAGTQSCPYMVLQTAESVPLPLAVAPPAVTAGAPPAMQAEMLPAPVASVLPACDLYLRNRVLLI